MTGSPLETSESARAEPGGESSSQNLVSAATAYARSLSALIHSKDLEQITARICEAIVEDDSYAVAWVGLAEDGPDQAVRIMARAGDTQNWASDLTVSWSGDRPGGRGPTGEAIRTGLASLREDSAVAPDHVPWRDWAARHGIRSTLGLPIKADGEVLGALVISSRTVNAFGSREIALFEQLANELGLAIQLEETRVRLAAEQARGLESARRFRQLFEEAPIGFVIFTSDLVIIDVNPRACAKFGYTREELLTLRPTMLVAPGQDQLLQEAMEAVTTQGVHRHAWSLMRKDGSPLQAEITATLMPDGAVLTMVRDVSEREQAVAAMHASDQRYRSLFDHAPDGILLADPNTRYIDANAAACQLLGYAREELTGARAQDIVAPSRLDGIADAIARLDRGETVTGETELRRKDGAIFPAEINASRAPDGQYLLMIRDISERKAAETARAVLDRRYRQLFQAAHDGIIATKPGGGILEVNPSMSRITGLSREQLLASQARDLVSLELRPSVWPAVNALKLGESYSTEFEFTRADGTTTPVGVSVSPTDDGAWMAIVRDQTERKRAEAAEATRRAADARYRQLFESAPDGILVANWDRGIIEVNPALTLITGYETADLFGRHEMEFLTPLDPALLRRAEETLTTGQGFRGEGSVRCKDGSVVPIEFSINPTPDGNLMSIVRDVSERRSAEEARREVQAQLFRMARVASLGEIVVTIAHEINQPLAAIQSSSDAALRWLARTPPNHAEVRKLLERTRNETQRIKSIIHRTRDFVSKGDLDVEDVDLPSAISEVMTLVDGELQRAGVTVVDRFDHTLPPVRGNRVQVQQVIINLVLNAIDAMRAVEGRSRKLTVTALQTRTDEVTVTVEDSGEGFLPGDIDRVFDPFFTTKSDGTGLGLSLSRSIVEALGGRLSAQAAPGHGAIFQFTLPAAGMGGE